MKDSNNKPLIHTDGCGYISKNLAAIIQGIVIKGVKRQEKIDLKYQQVLKKILSNNWSLGRAYGLTFELMHYFSFSRVIFTSCFSYFPNSHFKTENYSIIMK